MKIIIVDDEHNARENLHTKMKQIPQITEINTFESPLEAFEHASKCPVDVAFLDIEMPEMTGIEMAMRLKAINPKLNVIFVTGYSEYAIDAFGLNASGYILKPANAGYIQTALDNLRYPVMPSNTRIRIQTFGNFEIFVEGKPLQITHSRAKELLAYLVNKRGTSVTKAQIAALLWEDREYNRSLQKQTQNVISQMMKIVKEADIEEIIIKVWNNLAVDVNKFECDYYQFCEGNPAAINSYVGEYMSEYSWAEMTAGMLTYKNNFLLYCFSIKQAMQNLRLFLFARIRQFLDFDTNSN